jgi:hypothetical protein
LFSQACITSACLKIMQRLQTIQVC